MKYETILKKVARKYHSVKEDGETYFLNKNGEVVAHENEQKNLLVMYAEKNNKVCGCHDIVGIAVAKDFELPSWCSQKGSDVIALSELLEPCNTFRRNSNRSLKRVCSEFLTFHNENLNNNKKVIATIGYVNLRQMWLEIGIRLDVSRRYCHFKEGIVLESLRSVRMCRERK